MFAPPLSTGQFLWYCPTNVSEPVWPSGEYKALGWSAEGPVLDSASAVLSLSEKLWFVDTVVTLSLTMNQTLTWFSSLPIFNAGVILAVTVSVAIGI